MPTVKRKPIKRNRRTADEVPRKKCPICGKEKAIERYFYKTLSPLFPDGTVPICSDCVKAHSINSDGTVNSKNLKIMCQKLDKPFYADLLKAAYDQQRKTNGFVSDEEICRKGRDIVGLYFKNINSLQQISGRTYANSEADGFVTPTGTSATLAEKKRMMSDFVSPTISDKPITDVIEINNEPIEWTDKDIRNMNYVISTLGRDPFSDSGLDEYDKKYGYNILAGYCDTDGLAEDGHKMQSVIEMSTLYCQVRRMSYLMNLELSKNIIDDSRIQKLTSAKATILKTISDIAKENNISSNNNKNSKQGQNSLTSKMREMIENGYSAIEVNLFDIKTSEAFKQIAAISNENIANQLTLDSNEYTEIVKEQREMIQKMDEENETLKEENRILKNKIINLENSKDGAAYGNN